MTQRRRQSKRSAAVTKRRLLELKLEKRAAETDLRLQKKKSEALKKVYSQEINKFSEEALRLGQIVDTLYPNHPSSEDLSLEWDNSEETPPSFLTDRTTLLTDRSQSVVDELIDDILNLDTPAECQDVVIHPEALDSGNSARRNTSTDNQFLDEAPLASVVPGHSNFDWPPRFPSQEPEDFDPFDSSSLNQDLVPVEEEEVFYSEVPVPQVVSTMEEEDYKLRLRAVKLARTKVKNVMKTFLAANVVSLHVPTYSDRLKEIRDELKAYQSLVAELVVDLNESDATDQGRVTELEQTEETLLQEVLTNETQVMEKVEQLLLTQPITKAEQESLELKRKELESKEEEKRIAKVEKKTKVEIDIEDVSARATTLTKMLHEVDKAEKLTDLEVREILAESKKWESKMEDIVASKVKIDKDVVGLDVSKDCKDKL